MTGVYVKAKSRKTWQGANRVNNSASPADTCASVKPSPVIGDMSIVSVGVEQGGWQYSDKLLRCGNRSRRMYRRFFGGDDSSELTATQVHCAFRSEDRSPTRCSILGTGSSASGGRPVASAKLNTNANYMALAPNAPRANGASLTERRNSSSRAGRVSMKFRLEKRRILDEQTRYGKVAPRAGFEPATNRLTAGCSTAELPGNSCSMRQRDGV